MFARPHLFLLAEPRDLHDFSGGFDAEINFVAYSNFCQGACALGVKVMRPGFHLEFADRVVVERDQLFWQINLCNCPLACCAGYAMGAAVIIMTGLGAGGSCKQQADGKC
jgi:hypothetical protein